jgi:spore coat polysaccharide biosynthesis predicted glycosyltransferase SpsG
MTGTGLDSSVRSNCIFIRADASSISGAGHVMRSLTVSNSLRQLGFECIFIQDYIHLDWLKVLIVNSGFTMQSLSQISSLLEDTHLLLVDSYKVSPSDIEFNIVNWGAVVQIVDPETPLIQSSLYISPNPLPDSRLFNLQVPKYEGIEYIPIRDQFLIDKDSSKRISTSEPKILVSGGGSNIFNFVETTCEILRHLNLPLNVTALTSSETVSCWNDSRFSVCRLGNLNALDISLFNVFITTAGQSSWEFLATNRQIGVALGVPNQESTYGFLVDNNLASGLGFHDELGWHIDQELLTGLVRSSGSARNQSTVKISENFGSGAKLISEKILELFSF